MGTTQQALSAQVFVNIRPMDSVTAARQLPMVALLWRRVCKSRIPRQWNGYRAPIHQIDHQARVALVEQLDSILKDPYG